jgi:hypothetical protein
MTTKEIEIVRRNKKLSKDELDSFWDNFSIFLIIIIYFLTTSLIFFKGVIDNNSNNIQVLLFTSGIIVLFYTIWSKINEKKLKKIKTELSVEKNKKLIKELCRSEKWELTFIKGSYFQVSMKAFFNIESHKLIFICSENEILYNLRNIGSHRGRMPYNFGIDTIMEFNIRKKIKNYAQHLV